MQALYRFAAESTGSDLTWLLWAALIFFFSMVVIGWLVSRNKIEQSLVVSHAHHEEEPAFKSADDLKKIEGIGPKVQEVLNAAGIASFADLAGTPVDRVQAVLDDAGLQMMDPAGWVIQAELAAKGAWEQLANLQDELKGGRITD